MCRSMTTASGRSSRTASTAARPVGRRPDDLDLAGLGEHRLQAAQERRVVVGQHDADHGTTSAVALVQRQPGAHRACRRRRRPDGEVAADLGGPLAHREQPDAGAPLLRQAGAVVADLEHQVAVPRRRTTRSTRAGRAWRTAFVTRLLADQPGRHLDGGGQAGAATVALDVDPQVRAARGDHGGVLAQGAQQAELVQRPAAAAPR